MAILSFALGIIGLFFSQARGGFLLAVLSGALALYVSYRVLQHIDPKSIWQRAMSIAGACLGAISILLCCLALLSSRGRRSQAWLEQQEAQSTTVQEPVVGAERPPRSRLKLRPDMRSRGGPNPLPEAGVTNFSSNLPVIVIDTGGQPILDYDDSLVTARFINETNGRNRIAGPSEYDGRAIMKLHGTSTTRLPKRSYNLHPVDDKTNQVKLSLLGLPKEEDWVLYAPYEDKTMLRDALAYELWNQMGRYAPRTKFVELFLNTSGGPLSLRDYAGVYLLVEKIKRGKNRVNIEPLPRSAISEPELTGGYIFKRDHPERNEMGFYTPHGGPYYYVYPKARDITSAQKAWLLNYLNNFESALFGPSFADPQNGYAAYLDVASFIDAHWLIELTKNVDGFRYSAYLTKDRNGKLKTEPPWDYNRSFGNADYYGGWQVDNWYWPNLRPREISWYSRLRQDPEFLRRCTERWFELRRSVFDPKQIASRIHDMTAQLQEAQQRNFHRWPILGQQVTCNYYVGDSFQEEVLWLKNWIANRIAWIDSQLSAPPKLSPERALLKPGAVPDPITSAASMALGISPRPTRPLQDR